MSAHMILLAAKALNKRNALPVPEQEAELWAVYGGRLKGDAKAMLEACGALELLEACKSVLLREDIADGELGDLVRAAIAKATGGAA